MKPLTDIQIRNLKRQDRRIDLPDGGVPGLMLRVTPGGTKTWSMQYRLGGAGGITDRGHKLKGRERCRVTIGRYPETSIAEAMANCFSILGGWPIAAKTPVHT